MFENFTQIAFSRREMMYLSYSFLICLGKQMLRMTNFNASLPRYMTVHFVKYHQQYKPNEMEIFRNALNTNNIVNLQRNI